jgi:uncharacterized protein (UPF0276 family)
VNNVWVNAANFGFDPLEYLAGIDARSVAQFHLAGHESRGALLVDTHAARVAPAVWDLFSAAVERIGPRPTLIEWDAALPALDVLLEEARIAEGVLEARSQEALA